MVVVREFDSKKDLVGVEDVERRCEVGPSGKLSLFTDLLGDPICRVRHSPAFLMLVHTKCFVLLPFSVTPSLPSFTRTKTNNHNVGRGSLLLLLTEINNALISFCLFVCIWTRWLRWARRKR